MRIPYAFFLACFLWMTAFGAPRGSVALIVSVGSDGIVHDAQVTKSLEPSLDQQALKAVKNWKFTPAQCGDRYVPAEIGVETKFDIF